MVAACTPLHVRRHAAAATLAATVLATGLASVAHSLTHPGAIPNRAEIRDPGATSQGQIDSARYIRDRSGRHDLVATNRHCAAPGTPVCESRRFLVAAYSERQVLLEGWAYTPTISALSPEGRTSLTHPFWDPALQRLNDGFFVAPTAAARDALWAKGVRWVYVDNLFAHRASFAPYATRRFAATDGTSSAWQLLPPG